MKICLNCSAEIAGEDWRCRRCGWAPSQADGTLLFAPQAAGANASYDPGRYEELAALESKSFWFVARNRLIGWLARRHAPAEGKYLELGCGTGFVLDMLHRAFPGWAAFATEAQPEGIRLARNRVRGGVTFFQVDACAIPFRDEFDVIGAFDVIEHIPDDGAAIRQICGALKPGAILLVSVPQHMLLWGRYDEASGHFRRYGVGELEGKLGAAGLTVLESTSFNALPLPMMLASRLLRGRRRGEAFDVLDELRLPPALNWLLARVLDAEFQLIRLGLKFPVGGSRIIVARKAADCGEAGKTWGT